MGETQKHHNISVPLQWRHNEHDIVSNHQCLYCLISRLFGHRAKETSKLRVTGLCARNSPGACELHKRPVTPKMFPFDDVIMLLALEDRSRTYSGGASHSAKKSPFPVFSYFCQNQGYLSYLLNIRFIFYRCYHSSAAVTPTKYGRD